MSRLGVFFIDLSIDSAIFLLFLLKPCGYPYMAAFAKASMPKPVIVRYALFRGTMSHSDRSGPSRGQVIA